MDSHLKVVGGDDEQPSLRVPLAEPPSTVRPQGAGYIYSDTTYGVRLQFKRLDRGKDPSAQVVFYSNSSPNPERPLRTFRIKMLGSNNKRDIAKAMSECCAVVPVWPEIIERACQALMAELETVSPRAPRSLANMVPPHRPDRVLGFLRDGTLNLLYGPGGVGKGWLAIYAALCVQQGQPFAGAPVHQGNVLYLDWEDDEETFDTRVIVVAAGNDLAPVAPRYLAMRGPLIDQVDGLVDYCAEEKIAMVVIDSVSKAFPRGEYASYEATADELAQVSRLLPTTLAIDHVAGGAVEADTLAGKPIGGIGKTNAARVQWEARGHQEGTRLWVALHQTKRNHTAKLVPLTFELVFDHPEEPTTVSIDRIKLSDVPELARHDALAARLDHLLTHGRYTYAQIFEELGVGRDEGARQTIRATVARKVKGGVYCREGDGKGAVYWKPTVAG